ncbi:MAG TPA: hypothetical protein PLF23_21645 [Candidatus Obscuribacter sp.]|nr:hypothetical protein [Candidatus Obscuribacter sp.]
MGQGREKQAAGEAADAVSENSAYDATMGGASAKGLYETLADSGRTSLDSRQAANLPDLMLSNQEATGKLSGGADDSTSDSFLPTKVKQNEDGSAVFKFDNGLKIEMEPDGDGTPGSDQVFQSRKMTVVDGETGEETTLPGSLRIEKSGADALVELEFSDLSMTMHLNKAEHTAHVSVNDSTKIDMDGAGNVDFLSPDREIHLRSDSNYSERDFLRGTSYNVDRHGIVTTTDAAGKSEHFRLSVQGAEGARLQGLQQDQQNGEVYAEFSDGTKRKLYLNNNVFKSTWTETKPDGSQKECSDTLKVDDFAKSHLTVRLYFAKNMRVPDASGRTVLDTLE